mmetsp:Transcript_48800/g.87887  ORF Transcript_48800/g.87887 Transcript_48800/m.87887 type:complete len:445 (-) Transcript_48800:83-1417(-)
MGWEDWKDKGDQSWGNSGHDWNKQDDKRSWRNDWGKDRSWDSQKRGSNDDWHASDSKRGRWHEDVKEEATRQPEARPGMKMPQTPVDALRAASPPIPSASPGMRAPSTPAALLSGPSFQSQGGAGQAAPITPSGLGVPGTPAIPGTPAGRNPSTPAFRMPSTPAGAQPGTPSGMVNRQASARSGLATPRGIGGQQVVEAAPELARPSAPTHADPRARNNLRHAPRRKSQTGAIVVPSTPAVLPAHWNKPTAGQKAVKVVQEDPIPDFKKWKQMRQGNKPVLEAARRKAQKEAELRSAPQTDTPVPLQPGDATPGLPSLAMAVKAPDYGSETPVEGGGMTPMLPAAGMNGEMTPFLSATPMAGDQTPQVRVANQAYGQLVGDQTPVWGGKAEASGADTPALGGGMTPSLGATPQLAGAVTPQLGRGGDETPRMPGSASGYMTPAV